MERKKGLLSERLSKDFQKSWPLNWTIKRKKKIDKGVEMKQISIRNKMSKCTGVGKCGVYQEQQVIKFAWCTGCNRGSNKQERKENVVVECVNSMEKTRPEDWGATEDFGLRREGDWLEMLPPLECKLHRGRICCIPSTFHSKFRVGI